MRAVSTPLPRLEINRDVEWRRDVETRTTSGVTCMERTSPGVAPAARAVFSVYCRRQFSLVSRLTFASVIRRSTQGLWYSSVRAPEDRPTGPVVIILRLVRLGIV